jgi:hypothetical protein
LGVKGIVILIATFFLMRAGATNSSGARGEERRLIGTNFNESVPALLVGCVHRAGVALWQSRANLASYSPTDFGWLIAQSSRHPGAFVRVGGQFVDRHTDGLSRWRGDLKSGPAQADAAANEILEMFELGPDKRLKIHALPLTPDQQVLRAYALQRVHENLADPMIVPWLLIPS